MSALFVFVLVLLCAMLLPLASEQAPQLAYVQLGLWSLLMGGAMGHFLVLGTRINARYKKNRSVLLGEQLGPSARLHLSGGRHWRCCSRGQGRVHLHARENCPRALDPCPARALGAGRHERAHARAAPGVRAQ